MERPLAVDLFTGLHGWANGLVAEGWHVVGVDVEDMSAKFGLPKPDHFDLIIQDVLTLHGRQFAGASLIVASPPCQAYSYRAMPWSRAKALPPPDNTLFEACFRIQREASEAAGRRIPLIVENVRGAQKWVGRAKYHYGSFYIWGDVPALMPIITRQRMKAGVTHRSGDAPFLDFRTTKRPGQDWNNPDCRVHDVPDGYKGIPHRTKGHWTNPAGRESSTKGGGDWFGSGEDCSPQRRFSSKSSKRKMASALIAKIPPGLAQHIARTFKPRKGDSDGKSRKCRQ